MVCPDLLVWVVISLSVLARAQEAGGETDLTDSLELANDYSDYADSSIEYYDDYGSGEYTDDNLRPDIPNRGDQEGHIDQVIAVEAWEGFDYHNDFMDPTFCRENCQEASDHNNPLYNQCAITCPKTPWVSRADVSLELSCTTEAAVLSYDLSKLLAKNFKDLKIELSQEKENGVEESLEAAEDGMMSYEEYTVSPLDFNGITFDNDRKNEVSDRFTDR